MRKLVFIALLTAITPCVCAAQRMISAAPRFGGVPHRHHGGYYPLPFFSDPFYSDVFYSNGNPVAAQPPVIIVQSPPAQESIPERPSSPTQPLMIELQGDRYVRVSGEEAWGTEMIEQPAPPALKMQPGAPAKTVAPHALDTVVLLFRDGHREEVSDYTIADGILYARGDYYRDGYWNKKIELSTLNLPETVATNRSRGMRFQLPTAPNEVIVRP